ncbi:HPr family phosphocarrier protein [Fusibacillus kribbianus]|uniref:HPr family phosphocarrier protein n=1 Tax=Fusibacillus kribbianus TaxID=3044208 RepID=A0AAP4BAV3_9FIRM|nr:HPr family phosphocarrier protein [Ruminococcus sp. YH-rum2234]MDI9242660.1 HPr family phosphocarrier protein [Ruminococcus sp. YH-rum2234]
MITRKITIGIPAGLEARPVAMLVQVASQYDSTIYIEDGSRKVNAKSIMGMMALGMGAGESVQVTVNGEDEVKAMEAIEKYLKSES